MVTKSEKKSETIEVRMGYSQKRSFMDACKRNGKNASNVIRDYVDAYVAPKPGPNGLSVLKKWVLVPVGFLTLLTVTVGLGLGSLTFSPETSASLFTSLDTNADGVISQADIHEGNVATVSQFLQWADADADGEISKDEFKSVKTFDASSLGLSDRGEVADGKASAVFSVELGVGKAED